MMSSIHLRMMRTILAYRLKNCRAYKPNTEYIITVYSINIQKENMKCFPESEEKNMLVFVEFEFYFSQI